LTHQDLCSIQQIVAEAPFLTEGTLRWWIFHKDTNGLRRAIFKIGGRVYIDRTEFNAWLEEKRLAPPQHRPA